ncbi:MAG: DUF485 domain-containing protein [Gammaproteobacteria bacterium]
MAATAAANNKPEHNIDWSAIDADPKFQELHRKKKTLIVTLMIVSMIYYFLLPIGGGYFPGIFTVKVWGPVNVGLLFALSQFVVAWIIAAVYAARANGEFDRLAAEVRKNAERHGVLKPAATESTERKKGAA